MANTSKLSPAEYGPDYTLTCYGQVSSLCGHKIPQVHVQWVAQIGGILCLGPPFLGPGTIQKNVWKKLKSRNYSTIKHARIARGKGLRYTWHFSIILICSRVKKCRFQFFCSCRYISALKSFSTFYCGTYLSSCHQIASDAKYWTIRALFIAMTTSCLEESAPA